MSVSLASLLPSSAGGPSAIGWHTAAVHKCSPTASVLSSHGAVIQRSLGLCRSSTNFEVVHIDDCIPNGAPGVDQTYAYRLKLRRPLKVFTSLPSATAHCVTC